MECGAVPQYIVPRMHISGLHIEGHCPECDGRMGANNLWLKKSDCQVEEEPTDDDWDTDLAAVRAEYLATFRQKTTNKEHKMPSMSQKKFRQVPVGWYDVLFREEEDRMRPAFEDPSREEPACYFKFEGRLVGSEDGPIEKITVIVADKGGPKASLPKLVARMGGVSTKDEFGITCHPAMLVACKPQVDELLRTNFDAWEHQRFVVEVKPNGEDEDGDPKTKAAWDGVYRWPGEPRLLAPLAPETVKLPEPAVEPKEAKPKLKPGDEGFDPFSEEG